MKLDIQENQGFFADPDMIKSGEYYYIYPTTDGYPGWSGTEFYVYRSLDMKKWENRGKILDLISDVPWSIGSAWAPCMLYRNEKYYFYFCGKREDGVSCIGVAVSDSPEGPFVAQPEPILTPEMVRECGCVVGQTIDPSVYVEEHKVYLLFGNGDGLICELEDDCLQVNKNTIKNIKGMKDFRESVIVVKRGDIYHFTWSCDDTGSENYHVNYGTSESLFGPVQYHYPILEKDISQGILGTGHHSIFEENGNYTIVYHRFGTPLERVTEGKGFHRELCLDTLEFGEDGFMKKVVVTK